ncbi:MAG TPA: alcohol dehydrogenase catalytic domain-containing protein [Acidimicrobiia bacterium]
MNALRLHAAGELHLHEEPDPEPQPGEVLVRIRGVGLCGSDRHWFLEGGIGDAVLRAPLVLGHEFAGVVVEGPRAGERVVLDPAVPCGRCPLCLAGQGHLCADLRFAGHGSTDGALRTLVAWPDQLVHALPDAVADEAAPLLEPLGVALHAVDLGGASAGSTAAVFGCGPLGLLLVQALRAAGVRVELAADPLAHRAAAARELGARSSEPAGVEVDVAYEAAGDDEALDAAIAAARPGGRVVLVGIPDGDRSSFHAAAARRKELALAFCRRMRASDLPRAIRLAESGGLELGALVTARYGLAEGPQAFRDLVERRGLKIVVEPAR